jgi:uncharacterized repeat protein (TIGR03803 family)
MSRKIFSFATCKISALLALCIFLSSAASAQFAYTFQGTPDGALPEGGLVKDSSGNLYGTTGSGGAFGAGSIYELPASGGEKVLYSFTGGADGASPTGRILRQANGFLIGTAAAGSNLGGNCGFLNGCGVVWALSPGGKLRVLYTFTGETDGAVPRSGLVRGANGLFYGTTQYGGSSTGPCIASSETTFGCGVAFQVDLQGAYSVLHTFNGGSDGQSPIAPLTLDASGNLYGTTLYGGSTSAVCTAQEFKGCGVVFKIDSSGQESVVYAFNGAPDAAWPLENDVTLDATGNLYGSTTGGGASQWGAVYKIDSAGHESVLYSFSAGMDGAAPRSGLIRDPKGNLYGTASTGPINSLGQCSAATCGGLFKLTPTGTETVLFSFPANYIPVGDLLLNQGNLYGTTLSGGADNAGVVFKIKP